MTRDLRCSAGKARGAAPILVLLLAALAAFSCSGDRAAGPRVLTTFSGVFVLDAVDGAPLPTSIDAELAFPFQVAAGQLSFEPPPGTMSFSTHGTANGTPVVLSMAGGGTYARGDSFFTDAGLRGRVSGNIAELRTVPGLYGTHLWHFVKP